MNTKKLISAFVLALLVSSPFSANATIIDFESVITGSCQVSAGGPVDGFTLSSNTAGFNNSSGCNFITPTANSGTQFMLNFNNKVAEFTVDVGTFDLSSLFVTADIRENVSTVRFQGLDGIGGTLLHSRDVVILPVWQQVTFSGWNDISTFTWESLTPSVSNIAIDDFEFNRVIASVPEPGALALLALGLSVMGAQRRRGNAQVEGGVRSPAVRFRTLSRNCLINHNILDTEISAK